MPELPVAGWALSGGLPAKQRVRQAFDQAASTYDAAADVQREVCDRLAAYWLQSGVELEPGAILDAGCGTGYGGHWLAQRWPRARLALVDFAPEMLVAARARATGASLVCADIEALPLPDRCCELYWSNGTIPTDACWRRGGCSGRGARWRSRPWARTISQNCATRSRRSMITRMS